MKHLQTANNVQSKNFINGIALAKRNESGATGNFNVNIICDRSLHAATLSNQIKRTGLVQELRHFSCLADFIFSDAYQPASVLFIDLQMLDENTIKGIEDDCPGIIIIALCSAHPEQENYHDCVFSFLKEPFVFGEVFAIMNNAKHLCNSIMKIQNENKKQFVLIKSEYKLVKINLEEILFVAGMKDYIKIWLKDKTAPVTTLQNLKEFERKLPQQYFIRVHKSYIVALQHIDSIARNEIMIGNYAIPVGDAFRDGLNGFIRDHS